MTQDEMVDLGRVLRAVTELQSEVKELRAATHRAVTDLQGEVKELRSTTHHLATESMRLRHTIRKLLCMGDVDSDEKTDPDCPALLSDMPPAQYRERLRSIGDDEPDSVVTRPISVHAGMVTVRGPSIMVGAVLVLLGLIAAAVFVLRPALAALVH